MLSWLICGLTNLVRINTWTAAFGVLVVGLTYLVTGVVGFRASINADDEKTKKFEKWLFGIVGGVGLLMVILGIGYFFCPLDTKKNGKDGNIKRVKHGETTNPKSFNQRNIKNSQSKPHPTANGDNPFRSRQTASTPVKTPTPVISRRNRGRFRRGGRGK